MKTKILALALLLTLSSTALIAQGLKIGIKGGANIHKLDGKSFKDEFAFGYHVGGFADIGITSKWGIQPEVLFSQVNIDTSSSFSKVYQFNKMSQVQLKYLQIPILLNYKPNAFVSLQVGPQYGILMDNGNNLVQNGKDAFKKGDFSMVGGLQINISKIKLYGRYVVGLSNINDIDNQEKWKNQTIQLGIGFSIL
ncbi:MAG: porin family protein [Ferruginibacter sp.]